MTCAHHKLAPRSVCPSCGAWVSALDVARAYMERRLTAGSGWLVERDAAGTAVRMYWMGPA